MLGRKFIRYNRDILKKETYLFLGIMDQGSVKVSLGGVTKISFTI